jgi:hypothetical protein
MKGVLLLLLIMLSAMKHVNAYLASYINSIMPRREKEKVAT